MLTKLHKEAIVTGQLDNYCLVCEEHLNYDELDAHIAKKKHVDKRSAVKYTKDFEDDLILKIKKRYYCICCNFLLSTATKVGLHVKDDKHVNNKGIMHMKRNGDTILIKNDIKISKNAWNGFISNNCVLCDTEVDDMKSHETETDHILNLVQSQVQFRDDNVYRKIDDSFHCLTCNKIFPLSNIKSHFDNVEHKRQFSIFKYDLMFKASSDKTDKEDKANATKPAIGSDGKNKEENGTSKTPKKGKTNNISKTGVNIDIVEAMSDILDAKYTKYVVDDENGEPYCLTCDWQLDMGPVLEHLGNQHHLNMLKLHEKRLEKKLKDQSTAKKNKNDNAPQQSSDIKETNNNVEQPKEVKDNDFDKKKGNKKQYENASQESSDTKETNNNVEQSKGGENNDFNKKKGNKKQKATDSKKAEENDKKSDVNDEEKVDSRPSSAASGASAKVKDDIYRFVDENDMEYDIANNKVYCKHCHAHMSATWKILKSHASSTQHKQRHSKLSKKIPMLKFIKQFNIVQNPLSKDCVINKKYVVTWLSLLMLTEEDDGMRCACCDVEFESSVTEFEGHIQTPGHIAAMRDNYFISSMDSEFIREIRANTYHCGFCNKVCNGEDGLNKHLATGSHCEAKNFSIWRLQRYLPVLSHNDAQSMQLLSFLKHLAECNF